MTSSIPASSAPTPVGSNTVSSFILTDDAAGLIAFVVEVFGAVDVAEARTNDTDGLILHSELLIGDSLITIADRKPQWPYTPAFTRVYVNDVSATLARAVAAGGEIITEPTYFWGDVFSRFADPHGNLWWVYKHNPPTDPEESPAEIPTESDAWDGGDGGDSWESYTSPELEYIHSTLAEAMESLGDPRTTGTGKSA